MDKKTLRKKAKKIKLFLTDVDGVLTDGSLIYGNNGMELKVFNVTDGVGMILLGFAGIKTGIITAKYSSMTEKRAKEMCVSELYQGIFDKADVLNKLIKKYELTADEIVYIGDDLGDLPVLEKVGFPVTVPDAPDEVKRRAIYITKCSGGKGAVREIAAFILRSQGKYIKAIKEFFKQTKK